MGSQKRRWRYYRTTTGASPVADFLADLAVADRAATAAAMRQVRLLGLLAARHLRGDIYEVRSERAGRAWRILFANEGARGQVLLAVHGFEKKSQRTPPSELELAERRLRDWQSRGRQG